MAKSRELPYNDRQRHHVLFNRYAWVSTGEHNRLRSTKELIVPILINPHKALHRAIEQVPLPDHHMIKRIGSEFYPAKNDTVGSIRNLQEAIECAMDNPYTSELASGLGRLVIATLEAEIPFIEEGL